MLRSLDGDGRGLTRSVWRWNPIWTFWRVPTDTVSSHARRSLDAPQGAVSVARSRAGHNEAMESLRGKLLIASPRIADPNFHRTVVLMVEHGDEGAMGLVLNRPTDANVGEVVAELAWLAGEDDEPIWLGGPVAADGVIVVGEFDDPAQAALVVAGDVGLVPIDVDDRDGFIDGLRRTRVFAGHAGWDAGQLEGEMEEDSWIVEPALPEDVFTADAGGLWATVLRRKGREFALLSTMPANPALN